MTEFVVPKDGALSADDMHVYTRRGDGSSDAVLTAVCRIRIATAHVTAYPDLAALIMETARDI